MKVQFKVIEWDWKEQPDWNEINEAVKGMGGRAYFHKVDTYSDSYGVMISDTPLLPEEVELLLEP